MDVEREGLKLQRSGGLECRMTFLMFAPTELMKSALLLCEGTYIHTHRGALNLHRRLPADISSGSFYWILLWQAAFGRRRGPSPPAFSSSLSHTHTHTHTQIQHIACKGRGHDAAKKSKRTKKDTSESIFPSARLYLFSFLHFLRLIPYYTTTLLFGVLFVLPLDAERLRETRNILTESIGVIINSNRSILFPIGLQASL